MAGNRLMRFVLLILLLFSAVYVRMHFVYSPGHKGDISKHAAWFNDIKEYGPFEVYSKTTCNFPPVWVFIMAAMTYLKTIIPHNYELIMYLKTPAVMADILTGLLIYVTLVKEKGFKIAYLSSFFFLFNPAVIYLSSYWGKWDSVAGFLMFFSLVLAYKNHILPSWIIMTLGFLTKLQIIIFFPLLFFYTLKIQGLKNLIKSLLISIITFALVLSPYVYHNQSRNLYHDVWTQSMRIRPVVTGNAYNTWRLITNIHGFDISDTSWYNGLSDQTYFYGFIKYRIIGFILFGFSYLITLFFIWKSKNSYVLYYAAFYTAFSFFMLPTRVYDRYLFYTMSPAASIMLLDRRVKFLYATISTTLLLNLVHVLTSFYGYWGAQFFSRISGEILYISLLNILCYVYATLIMLRLDTGFNKRASRFLGFFKRNKICYFALFFSVLLLYTMASSRCKTGKNIIYLSDITYQSARQDYGTLSLDKSVDKKPLSINDHSFCRGLGTHSNSEIVYDVSGFNASRFVSWVGVDDESSYGSVVFMVFGDEELLYLSRLLRNGDEPDFVDVPVTGVSELRLVVTDGGDRGDVGDHADWANARLLLS